MTNAEVRVASYIIILKIPNETLPMSAKQDGRAIEVPYLASLIPLAPPSFLKGMYTGIEVVVFREEFPTTSKLLRSTYLQNKGDCSLKALKFILGRTLIHVAMGS